jgi:hypothetical protein
MKTSLLLLAAFLALVLVVALPAFKAGGTPTTVEAPRSDTSGLVGNVESGTPCRLVVDVGPETAFDRGRLADLHEETIAAASFRYWQESAGPVLYVYDDVQDLVGRIVNPACVRVLCHTDTP